MQSKHSLTFCNEFVFLVAHEAGTDELWNKTANEIVEHIKLSERWCEVLETQAQTDANQEKLVIAGWQSSHEGYGGHVCIVIPGMMQNSPSHGIMLPTVANVGVSNFHWNHAGFAFSKEKRPRFWTWKGEL